MSSRIQQTRRSLNYIQIEYQNTAAKNTTKHSNNLTIPFRNHRPQYIPRSTHPAINISPSCQLTKATHRHSGGASDKL